MRTPAFAAALLFGSAVAMADVSPKDLPLPPGQITRITVAYDGQDVVSGGGKIVLSPGEYHYDVYLPDDYDADPSRRFPCLFVADPGGNARLGTFSDRVKGSGMVAVLLVESRNGKTDPIVGNFLAAYDDAIKRLRIAPGFLYMTGMSGGARSTAIDVTLRPGFAGVILQGAGLPTVANVFSKSQPFAVFATFGVKDPNRGEVGQLATKTPATFPFRYRLFDGGHQPAPRALAEEGLDFLEQWAYFTAPTRPDAASIYLRRFDELLTRADAATSDFEKYDLLDSATRLAVARGLAKDAAAAARVEAARDAMTKLAAGPAFKMEKDAKVAFGKVESAEDFNRRRAASRAGVLAGVVEKAKGGYEAVAKQFPETLYGKRAAAEAERLAFETGVDVSTLRPMTPPGARHRRAIERGLYSSSSNTTVPEAT